MDLRYRDTLRALFEHFRTSPGESSIAERQDVEHWSASLAGASTENIVEPQPDALRTYLEKVTLHAYKVTDRDVQQLKEAGYSEDQIFELTLSAILGVSRARLDRGLELLQQEAAECV